MNQSDVQRLIFDSYKQLNHSCFLFVRVSDVALARNALVELETRVPYGQAGDDSVSGAIHLAFTYRGLGQLGLPSAVLDRFPQEFAEGMEDETRARALGDEGDDAPGQWSWGGPTNLVHAVFLLYGDASSIEGLLSDVKATIAGAFEVAYERRGVSLGEKEHFGFTDGISQPRPFDAPETDPDYVPAGEFVIGEPNVYGKQELEPLLSADSPASAENSFGYHGSYLVARQLDQDVEAFWSFFDQAAGKAKGSPDPTLRDCLAAKAVGRHKDGTPLVGLQEPANGDPQKLNAFDYSNDKLGYSCPVGAHVRRANPRDSLDPGPEESRVSVRSRRIMRRGRSYGEPNWTPLSTAEAPKVERGLVFLCLNASIRRQFEFVQQMWINNVKFGGLCDERDPLIGAPPTNFTIPDKPVRQRLGSVARFTKLRGGGYFFLPSRGALKHLAALS